MWQKRIYRPCGIIQRSLLFHSAYIECNPGHAVYDTGEQDGRHGPNRSIMRMNRCRLLPYGSQVSCRRTNAATGIIACGRTPQARDAEAGTPTHPRPHESWTRYYSLPAKERDACVWAMPTGHPHPVFSFCYLGLFTYYKLRKQKIATWLHDNLVVIS